MVKLKIDNYEVEVPAGTSILEAARTVQIDIPTLCKHPDVDPSAGCGICIVKVNGRILRSCCTPVAEGMEIITSDPEIVNVRRTVLELILSNHPNECHLYPFRTLRIAGFIEYFRNFAVASAEFEQEI